MSNKYTFKPSGSKTSGANAPSGSRGFDAGFSDLTMSACPPSTKRPRVGGPAKPTTPKKSGLAKAPLKFDFKSVKAEASAPAAPRYVCKPVLASQLPPRPLDKEPVASDDWGSDDNDLLIAASQAESAWTFDGCDDDLLFAASQMAETEDPFNKKVEEEELLAMTALLEEDFGLDDLDMEEEFNAPKEEERLHQTMTIFEPEVRPEPKPIFKPPPLPKTSKTESELSKLKNEHESLQTKFLKGQGETTMLRDVLNKKERDLNLEKIERRKAEEELTAKMKEQIAKSETQQSTMKTENLFLLQEINNLKEKLKKVEINVANSTRQPLTEQGQIKQEQKPFVNSNDFFGSKSAKNSTSTQTTVKFHRKCLPTRNRHPNRAYAETFCKVSSIDDKTKTDILHALGSTEIERKLRLVLTRELNTLIDVTDNNSTNESLSERLGNCVKLITSCNRGFFHPSDHKLVTETCSKLLTSIMRTEDSSDLVSVLSLLMSSWSRGLPDSDLTSYIFSLLSQIVHRGKPASSKCRVPVTPDLIRLTLEMIDLITRSPQQSDLLCKQNFDDCFLFSVAYLLHHGLVDPSPEVRGMTVGSLVRWVLGCFTVSHPLPFLGDCTFCSGDIVRILTNATYHQVLSVLDNSSPSGVAVLKECISSMTGVQDIFGLAEWGDLLCQNVSVQRRYIWSLQQIDLLNLENRLAAIMVGENNMDCS